MEYAWRSDCFNVRIVRTLAGRILTLALAALLAIPMSACARTKGTSSGPDVAWETGDGWILGPAVQMADGWVYFTWLARGMSDTPAELRRVKPPTAEPTRLDVTGVNCEDPSMAYLRILPNGQLGAIQHCRDHESLLVSIDTNTGRAEKLAIVSPGTNVIFGGEGRDDWAEYLKNGCVAVALMKDGKRLPMPDMQPTSLIGGKVDAGFDRQDCHQMGRVGFPVPMDGATFVLATDQAQASDVSLGPAVWNLYRLDIRSKVIKRVGGSFTKPTAMAISGNGSLALVAGIFEGLEGMWAIDVTNGSVSQVAGGLFEAITYSADGKTVIGVQRVRDMYRIIRLGLPVVDPTRLGA